MNLKPLNSRIFCLISAVLIIVLGLLVYSNNYQCGWHFDDLSYIVNNPTIRTLDDIESIWKRLTAPGRTLVLYSFALNYHFGKTDIFGYHVVNNAIHILTALGVWCMALLMFFTPNLRSEKIYQHRYVLALFVGLIFVSHPMQTQAVTYICQRFASMATMFYVLSIAWYLAGRIFSRGRGLMFVLAAISAVLGMFSKQITMTIPIAISVIELIFFAERLRVKELLKRIKWFYVLPVVLCFLIVPALYKFNVSMILGIYHPSSGSFRGEPVDSYHYFLTQSRVILRYVQLLIFPIGQNLLYDFNMSKSWYEPRTLFSFLGLGGIFLFGLSQLRRNRLVAFGIFWFFITLLVESSIIPIRHVIFEHRAYLPSVGFSFFVVGGLYALIQQSNRRTIAMLAIILTLSHLTYQRNKVWLNEFTLWEDVKRKSPHKMRPYLNTGIAYSEQGEYDKAIYEFNRALEKNPRSILVMNNKGVVYTKQRQFDFAISEFNNALALDPDWAEVLNNRGDAYRHQKKYQLALEDYNRALEIKPDQYRTLSNRGVVYSHLGRNDLALNDLNAAIKADPDFIEAYQNRGNLHGILRRYDLAIADFSKVIIANANSPQVYNNRGNAYRRKKEYGKALADYNRAIALDSGFAEGYNNRGVVYRAQKKYAQAIADYNKAIELNPDYVMAYNNRANLYKLTSQYDLALRDFNTAIGIDSKNAVFYYNRAMTLIAQKNYFGALKDVEISESLGNKKAAPLKNKLKQFLHAQRQK